MRFSALGKIAGMGARSTIAQRKKMEKEAADAAAAAAAAKSRPMSRASSRASMGDSKAGTLVSFKHAYLQLSNYYFAYGNFKTGDFSVSCYFCTFA
jgi:hypothetical protein